MFVEVFAIEFTDAVFGLVARGIDAHDTDLLGVSAVQVFGHGPPRKRRSVAIRNVEIAVVVSVSGVCGDDVDSHDCSCLGLSNICLASVLVVGSSAGAAESFIATFGRIQFVDWLELHVRVW